MHNSVTPSNRDNRGAVASAVIQWFSLHKRDLPWRGGSPYSVWVSEIMLHQTRVATVAPYYIRFMEKFPALEYLAAADIESVLRLWAGLGYYARARNMLKAAQKMRDNHDSTVPSNMEQLLALPGVGRYTAGAVLSIGYGIPAPIVDANVIRVLSRLFGLYGDPDSTSNRAQLWALAEELVPSNQPGEFNQGLMEIGSLICTPAEPKCSQCPLLLYCEAEKLPDPSVLPEYAPEKAIVFSVHSSAIIQNSQGAYLIVQRPLHGLWGGLWEFPRVVCDPGENPAVSAVRAAWEEAGVKVYVKERLTVVKHVVMRQRITLHGFLSRLCSDVSIPRPPQNRDSRWAPLAEITDYPFSSPQSLLRERLLTSGKAPPDLELDLTISDN